MDEELRKAYQRSDERAPVVFGDLQVSLVEGDIFEQEVDAIVCSADTTFQLGGRRSMARQLLDRTGGKVQVALDTLSKGAPASIGTLRVTDPFGLPCKHLFFVAINDWEADQGRSEDELLAGRLGGIGESVGSVLEEARRRRLRSVALPLLSAGSLRFSSHLAAETMFNSISKIGQQKTGGKALDIRIVENDSSNIEEISQVFSSDTSDLLSLADAVGTVALGLAIGGPVGGIIGAAVGGIRGWLAKKKPAVGPGDADKISELVIKQLTIENQNLKARVQHLEQALRDDGPQSRAILAELPLPVAFAASWVERELTPVGKVRAVRAGFGSVMRYLGALSLAEFRHSGSFSAELGADLRQIFSADQGMTDGSWLEVVKRVSAAFHGEKRAMLLNGSAEALAPRKKEYSPLVGGLHGLLKLRNDDAHEVALSDDSSALAWLREAEPLWKKVLVHGAPIFRHSLVFVESLVDIGEKDAGRNQYLLRWLTGEFFVPRAEIVELDARLRKNQLYVMDGASSRFLALAPFLFYEHCKVTKAKEACCLNRVREDRVCLQTFRFPYQWEPDDLAAEIRSAFSSDRTPAS